MYGGEMRKIQISSALRDGMAVGASVFLASVLTGVTVYLTATASLKSELQNNLLKVAQSAAELTDVQAHQRITVPSDRGSPIYEHIRAPYFALLRANPDLAYLYTNVEKDGRVYFIMDASIPKPGQKDQPSAVMEEYKDASDKLKQALATHRAQVEDKPYSDEYGTFLSAYAPIFDGNRFVAVVGADIREDDYLSELAKVRGALILGLLVAAAAAFTSGVAVYRVRSRINQLQARHEADRHAAQLAELGSVLN